MRTLIYRGGPTGGRTRVLGPDDGLDLERRFPAGEPVEVSEADAARILEIEPDGFDETDAPAPDTTEED